MNGNEHLVPPAHSDIEEFVLAAICSDTEACGQVFDCLRAEDFSLEKNKRIFQRAWEIHNRGDVVNYVSVGKELERLNQLDFVGGLSCLVRLDEGKACVYNLEQYCRMVKVAAIKRRAFTHMQAMMERCCDPGDETAELVTAAERIGELLSSNGTGELPARPYEQVITDSGGINAFLSPETNPGIHIPFYDIHVTLSGLRRGRFIILGARPAVGKSALAIQIAEHAAANGNNVLFVALEMRAEDVLQRSATGRAGVSAYKFRHDLLDMRERRALQSEVSKLVELGDRLLVVDRSETTVLGISNLLRSLKARGKAIDLCIIDYLQLLSSNGRFENRVQEVSTISRGLKKITQAFGIPVLALSQLKRPENHSKNERPELDWLKESGQLEQDADQVIFLWVKRDPEEGDTTREVHWRVAKNRDGMLNHGTLNFNTRFCRFSESADDSEAAA